MRNNQPNKGLSEAAATNANNQPQFKETKKDTELPLFDCRQVDFISLLQPFHPDGFNHRNKLYGAGLSLRD
jgi:hypothetical protein